MLTRLRPVFLSLLLCSQLHAQAPRTITADVSQTTGTHDRFALNTVGAGRANEGLRADWQAQLATLQSEIGFRYLRFHGLLSDDMGVYTEDRDGTPHYSFQYVDALYDALLAHHIRPFVELGFMPGKLASGTQTIFWWNANVTPPKDMAKWQGLITALTQHWIERYGKDEVATWYFEVWNEPDLHGFFSAGLENYFPLYLATATSIKQVCAECRVGGPATATGHEKEFLDFVAASHAPVDFVSTHTYAVTKGALDADGTAGTVLDTKPNAIVGRVEGSHAAILASANPKLPLHYTEWSASYTPTDYIHDQYHEASFILDRLRKVQGIADSMSYWTFTDIFEELGPRFTPFHGGFGLINYQGIRKPAFFAYRFLSQLGPTDVAATDTLAVAPQHGPQSWVTRDGDRSFQALFWDYTPIAPPPGETDQTFYKREQPAAPATDAKLHLIHLPNGKYRIDVYRIGYQQNDAYTAYLKLGAPSQLTRAQVAELNARATEVPVSTEQITVGNGIFDRTFAMRQNDVYFVTLTHE